MFLCLQQLQLFLKFYIPPGGCEFELLVWFFHVNIKLVLGNFWKGVGGREQAT